MPVIHDMEVDDYLYECVTLDRTVLQKEYARVSPDMAYWSRQYAVGHREFLRSKLLLSRTKALAYAQCRDLLIAQRGKATLKDIEAAVEADSDVQEAEAQLIEDDFNCKCLKGNIEAVRSKREMLITLGAHVREEMKGNPRINQPADSANHARPDDGDWGGDEDGEGW